MGVLIQKFVNTKKFFVRLFCFLFISRWVAFFYYTLIYYIMYYYVLMYYYKRKPIISMVLGTTK